MLSFFFSLLFKVITKGISMFDEITKFIKQLSSNGPSHHCSFKSHFNVEEILKKERSGFEVSSSIIAMFFASFTCNEATNISPSFLNIQIGIHHEWF